MRVIGVDIGEGLEGIREPLRATTRWRGAKLCIKHLNFGLYIYTDLYRHALLMCPTVQPPKYGQTQFNRCIPPPPPTITITLTTVINEQTKKMEPTKQEMDEIFKVLKSQKSNKVSLTRRLYVTLRFPAFQASSLISFLSTSSHVLTVKRETQLGRASLLACTSASTVPPYTATWACIYPSYGMFITIFVLFVHYENVSSNFLIRRPPSTVHRLPLISFSTPPSSDPHKFSVLPTSTHGNFTNSAP